ncbi:MULTISPECIES: hypothetical protein [Paraburkholderia]|uniref:hypothetical protein n=1 Tax=Paraburkholderia TaxID=1822464 RepID=UPI002258A417|nr:MULTISPECIES: hypothetical protein [Paraburkholderia]MCX4155009.1 hypothetical protein [Paraburkholderia aspalathi]MDN7164419.1 hypothetical protein [Paraburkholderia sp. SECH2]MDQ6392904.1 hypothetical protein [Paraburkholderia aspalathi]
MRWLLLLAPLLLGACASLWYAGESDYAVTLPDGVVVTIHSGKQEQSVNAAFVQTPSGYVITLQETGVEAFKGQAVAAGAASDAVGAATTAVVTGLKLIK